MLRCQDEITFHEDNQLECLSRRSRRNQRLESERNDLTQEELRARQEKSPGREDYSGEIWIFAPSRGNTLLPRAHAIRGIAQRRYRSIRRQEVSLALSSTACALPAGTCRNHLYYGRSVMQIVKGSIEGKERANW